MEKEHFEILLEEMRSNFQLAFEGLDGVNGRLDRVEGRLDNVESRLDGLDRLEAGQQVILNRLQGVESQFKDHLDNHS